MPDTERAAAWGGSALDEDVALDSLLGLSFLSEPVMHKTNLEKEVREYKTNSLNQRRRAIVKKRYDEVEITVSLDSVQAQEAFTGTFGTPIGQDWEAFDSVPTYMNVAWYDGVTGEYRKMINAQVSKIQFTCNLNQEWRAKVTFWGPPATIVAANWTNVAVPPADISPFENWMTTISKVGASAFACVTDLDVTFDRNLHAVYCFPADAPDETTEPGLRPTRFALGVPKVTYKITIEYTGIGTAGGTASSTYNYLHNLSEAWVVSANQPGYGSLFTMSIPNMTGMTGEIVKSDPELYETINGEGLYDTGIAAHAQLHLEGP